MVDKSQCGRDLRFGRIIGNANPAPWILPRSVVVSVGSLLASPELP
jgi:hypothetical protein